jgi:hypothetical protein
MQTVIHSKELLFSGVTGQIDVKEVSKTGQPAEDHVQMLVW